jgi:hypothetical protein
MGYSMERCARHWNTVNRIMMDDAAALTRFRLVTYEALSMSPEATMRELAEFLGIDCAPFEQLTRMEWAAPNMTGATSKIQDFNRESFKRLSAEDLEMIRANAREMLECFGDLDSPAQYPHHARTTFYSTRNGAHPS